MGRKWKNRHGRQIDKFAPNDSSNDGRDSSGNGRYGGRQLGSYTVSGRSHTNCPPTSDHSQTNNNTHRPREPFQIRGHHNPRPNDHATIPRHVDHRTFILRSKRFKQQLLESIDQTLKHIEQWCPDDDSGEDEMDWQPEAEVVIPVPAETMVHANHAWIPTSSFRKRPLPTETQVGIKAAMNVPLAPTAMRRASCSNAFDARSAQNMKRAMDASVPRSCRYVVPTLVSSERLGLEADRGRGVRLSLMSHERIDNFSSTKLQL